MATQDEINAAIAKRDADAALQANINKLMTFAESVSARMDAFEDKFKKADEAKAKADAEEEEEKKKKDEEEKADAAKKADGAKADEDMTDDEKADAAKKADEAKADKAKADAAKAKADAEDDDGKKKEEEEKADAAAKADAEVIKKIADMEKRLPAEMTDEERDELSDAQAKSDSMYQAFGQQVPSPLNGEKPLAYRRRLISKFQNHSPAWKGVDLKLVGADVLAVAEPTIRMDAMTASNSPQPGEELSPLRARTRRDETGRNVTTFHGHPGAWLDEFKSPTQSVTKFDKGV